MHISGKQTATLRPGVYVGGIGIAGQATVTMLPGIYYMQGGGFSVSGPASVTGNGVMIYNAPVHNGDAVSITGQGAVTITPPTTGLYQGISIFQDRAASTPVKIAGHGDLSITGTFYAARASLNITGDGALNEIGSQYISYDLFLAGNGDITIDWVNNPTARARVIQLVE
jgi:hypothetical protein